MKFYRSGNKERKSDVFILALEFFPLFRPLFPFPYLGLEFKKQKKVMPVNVVTMLIIKRNNTIGLFGLNIICKKKFSE